LNPTQRRKKKPREMRNAEEAETPGFFGPGKRLSDLAAGHEQAISVWSPHQHPRDPARSHQGLIHLADV